MKKRLQRYLSLLGWSVGDVKMALHSLEMGTYAKRALNYSSGWKNGSDKIAKTNSVTPEVNPLREYFNAHTAGNGIWKWNHYFDIYHRHFNKFRGKEVSILEIGIYSGGSLPMWRSYFGDKCKVYGVDIQKECLAYKQDGVDIFIGDQSDRNFWKEFRSKVPQIDIVVDDGGHTTEQQIITLEEILPHISNGGVYLCEDVHGTSNHFASYINGLQKSLNHYDALGDADFSSKNSSFQKNIQSVHVYPYAVVIEKYEREVPLLSAPKHGTKWEPFL